MENKRSRLALVFTTLVLLLVLALGPAAPGAFALEAGSQIAAAGAGFVMPCAIDGGGSGGG